MAQSLHSGFPTKFGTDAPFVLRDPGEIEEIRMLTKCLAGLAALATVALTVPSAHAATVAYNFTSTVGNGSFSFDDTDTTSVPSSTLLNIAGGGLAYAIPSFVFNNVPVQHPYAVTFNDLYATRSILIVTPSGGVPELYLESSNANLFPGSTLATLDNLTFAEFDVFVGTFDASSRLGTVTSLTRVPEPPTLSLTASALGVAAARRRKIANRAAN